MKKIKKYLCSILVLVFCASFLLIKKVNTVESMTYQNTVTPTFTIAQSISMSVDSSSISIASLTPGQRNTSNTVSITVNSNNGYTLTGTVGNATYASTNLVNSSAVLSALTTATAYDSIAGGKWGYAISTDGGTSWSNYNGLALYTATPTTLRSRQGVAVAGEVTKFRIAASATASQTTGNYQNVITFNAVVNP